MTDRTTPGAPIICPCGAPEFSAYRAQEHELACPTVTRLKQRRVAVAALNAAGVSITRHHRLTTYQVQREDVVDLVLDAIAGLVPRLA